MIAIGFMSRKTKWGSLEAAALEMGEKPVHVVRVGRHRSAHRAADADDSTRDPGARERHLLLLEIHGPSSSRLMSRSVASRSRRHIIARDVILRRR
jgi:hypothetical protein